MCWIWRNSSCSVLRNNFSSEVTCACLIEKNSNSSAILERKKNDAYDFLINSVFYFSNIKEFYVIVSFWLMYSNVVKKNPEVDYITTLILLILKCFRCILTNFSLFCWPVVNNLLDLPCCCNPEQHTGLFLNIKIDLLLKLLDIPGKQFFRTLKSLKVFF